MTQSLHFGTDGIRGNASTYPFTAATLYQLGRAIGVWAQKNANEKIPTILIGQDTRESCDRIKNALIKGLSCFAHILDGGVLPTPAVSRLTNEHCNIDTGIIISASHNAYQDNGIKILNRSGQKITNDDEKEIIQLFKTDQHQEKIETPQLSTWSEAQFAYESSIIKKFPKQFLEGLTVVLDCAHGATSYCAPSIFTQLGAHVIAINAKPDGKNINYHCGTLHPKQLQQAVIEENALFGCAFDGDGDRVLLVNNKGELRNGDDILFLLADYLNLNVVVGTVMTNQGLEETFKKKGILLHRVPVGDKNIIQHLNRYNLSLGGEASGHIIIKDSTPTGDGIYIALECAYALSKSLNWNFPTFKKYPHIIVNTVIEQKQELKEEPYSSLIKHYESQLQNGRLFVRFSGTENVIRVMVETSSESEAQRIAQELSAALCSLLNNSSHNNKDSHAHHSTY